MTNKIAVALVGLWAGANASSGYCFAWKEQDDWNNFEITVTRCGCALSEDDYQIKPFKGHKKPPVGVIAAAKRLIASKAQVSDTGKDDHDGPRPSWYE